MRQTKAKRWRIEPGDETIEQELVRELGVYPVVAKLLVNRGITTVTAGRDFLYGNLGDLLDPYLLKGMKEAIPLIQEAMKNKNRLLFTAIMMWTALRLPL